MSSLARRVLILLAVACTSCAPRPVTPADRGPRSVTVCAYWDGGTAERTAERLAAPLERAFTTIQGVVRTVTRCDNKGCTVRLQHDPGIPSYEIAFEASTKIKQLRDGLPKGAEAVAYTSDFQRSPDLAVALVLDAERVQPEHYATAQEFARTVMQLPNTVRYEIPGMPVKETLVEIDPARAQKYGIGVSEIAAAVDQRILRVDDYSRIVIGRRPGTRGDVGNIVLKDVGRTAVRVRDVARVHTRMTPGAVYRVNQQPAILVRLFLRTGASPGEVGAGLRRVLKLARPPVVRQVVAVFARKR